ncbi:hypothetical protein [Mesorhizobium koreense]|uniref:hypothetical protein n=1 Tax=Mesorhizobium koreense TaxID=3074855 RepID=UPI00287BBCDA|nr:hypothetical protein [Mesorhizobium sp. WR6]
MQPSVSGILICGAILVFACWPTRSLFVGLAASMAFGATALVTLTSLGGSSPLIYTLFAGLLLAILPLRRGIRGDIGILFRYSHTAWLVCALLIYAVIGAVLFPRLFAGQTSVFVASRTLGGVYEVPLGPVSGNISQTGYFVLGGMVFLALSASLLRDNALAQVRQGFFLWCALHTGFGLLDLLGKLVGAGDVLAFLRTASYAMLTETTQAGFARIAGAQSEASAFASMSLAALAFAFTYWRRTASRFALALTLTLMVLLLLSTSSTAYVGLTLLGIPVAFSICRSLSMRRLHGQEIFLLALGFASLFVALGLAVHNDKFFDPMMRLVNQAIFEKAGSASGQERGYWNYISLKSFVDTLGLGVGIGSSRASSWPVAVLSQLGAVGCIMLTLLVLDIARRPAHLDTALDVRDAATVDSIRACALAGIVSGSLISGTADPGLIFFISLAVVTSSSIRISLQGRLSADQVPIPSAIRFAGTRAPGAGRPILWTR